MEGGEIMPNLAEGPEPKDEKKARSAIAEFANRTFSAAATMLLVDGIHELFVWLAS